jgi:thiamine biosynthesis lipoprotein
MSSTEAGISFPCFGSTCSVFVTGHGTLGSPERAVAEAKRLLLSWHERFTRFDPGSELSRLNDDPRTELPVSPLMARFAELVIVAAEDSGGLVDATLLEPLEAAGYVGDLNGGMPLAAALQLAPPRRAGGPLAPAPWRSLSVDRRHGVVRRPPGLRLDSGGLAKGLFADELARLLARHDCFAVDCAGDLRLGGASGVPRQVRVESPFDGDLLHSFELRRGGVATSGIGRRSWLGADGKPAHHLLDPASGRPAYTGVVQVTALAPTAAEAEVRAKAAILSGPGAAASWIPDGGVVVLDDGEVEVVTERRPRRTLAPRVPSAAAARG